MSGPVQVLVVEFDEPSFSGEVIAELTRLREAGTVRLVDVLLVRRDRGWDLRHPPSPTRCRSRPRPGRGRHPRRHRRTDPRRTERRRSSLVARRRRRAGLGGRGCNHEREGGGLGRAVPRRRPPPWPPMRVLAASDDVADDAGARSPAAWLAHHTRSSHGAALADARVAEALEHRWHQVRAGLLAGSVNLEQARVITRALDDLPDDLDADVVSRAEVYLVEQAAALRSAAPAGPGPQGPRGRRPRRRRGPRTPRPRGRGAPRPPPHPPHLPPPRRRHHRDPRPRLRRRRRTPAHLPRGLRQPTPRPTRQTIPTPRPPPAAAGERRYEVRLGRAFCALLEALPAKRPAPPRRLGHHPGRHHRARPAAPPGRRRQPRGRPRRTRATLGHRGAAAGLHRPDRPRRPRRQGAAAAPRAGPTALQRRPTPRHGGPRRHLPGRRLRHPRRLVRGPPPRTAVESTAGSPTSRTASSSAPSTTTAPTTPTTPPTCTPAACASAAEVGWADAADDSPPAERHRAPS